MFDKLEDLAKNNKKISDFHIRTGSPLAYRQTGEIIKVQEVVVKDQDLKDLLSMIPLCLINNHMNYIQNVYTHP